MLVAKKHFELHLTVISLCKLTRGAFIGMKTVILVWD